ncbi:MAG: hypothetical protein AAGD38_03230 [Acidobacteriota bacterium]
MIIRPMVGGWEVPSIEAIRVLEHRRLARFAVPGLDGMLQQDLGAGGLCIEIRGSLSGDEARDTFLEALQEAFRAAEPVSFSADIITATELEQVLIEHFDVREVNISDRAFEYRIVLRQYVEPPEPSLGLDDLSTPELDADLDFLADLGLDGLDLPDLLIDLPAISDPVEPVRPALEGVRQAVGGLGDLLGGLSDTLGVDS